MPRWRPIGIIGGMGPAATADFVTRLGIAVGAASDADHPRLFIDSNPHVPDRTAARAGTGPSPGPVLAAMAKGLVAQGAEVLAMPCNAAHGWADAIRAATPAVFVDIIEVAVAAAVARGARRIGILGIGATIEARLYHRRIEAEGLVAVDPDYAAIETLVLRVKAGDTGAAVCAAMAAQAGRLIAGGADAVIAACTEVPLVLVQTDVPVLLVDATATLIEATLAAAALPLSVAMAAKPGLPAQ
jgi:aspartate racemase